MVGGCAWMPCVHGAGVGTRNAPGWCGRGGTGWPNLGRRPEPGALCGGEVGGKRVQQLANGQVELVVEPGQGTRAMEQCTAWGAHDCNVQRGADNGQPKSHPPVEGTHVHVHAHAHHRSNTNSNRRTAAVPTQRSPQAPWVAGSQGTRAPDARAATTAHLHGSCLPVTGTRGRRRPSKW
jgi:hypothetical protein